jgi:hypothetical protein
MRFVLSIAAAVVCGSSLVVSQQPKPATSPPSAAEIEYDAFCKRTQQEKRAIFRAATPAQKAAIMRNQMERFRDANRARLSKTQLDLLGDVLAVLTPAAFADDREAQAKLEALSDRIGSTFPSEDEDAMDRDGPCIPKVKQPVEPGAPSR